MFVGKHFNLVLSNSTLHSINCPFCGSALGKVAAICPSCKIQLPESNLFSYYASALDRDKSLAQPDKRAKLDALVLKEAVTRKELLEAAKQRASADAARNEAERALREKELSEKHIASSAAARVKH